MTRYELLEKAARALMPKPHSCLTCGFPDYGPEHNNFSPLISLLLNLLTTEEYEALHERVNVLPKRTPYPSGFWRNSCFALEDFFIALREILGESA